MSINAVTRVSPDTQQKDQPQAVTPAPTVTPFSQQLDAANAQVGAAHGHHHHHQGGNSQSVMSPTTAASAAGAAPSGSIASSLAHQRS
jgi:hypothetical protein